MIALLGPALAVAQTPQTGGAVSQTAKREVRVFHFDEERQPDPVPPGWERTTLSPDGQARAGFPRYNRAELDTAVKYSGTRSLRLPTAGGSTAIRLRPGEAPVFADADYAVVARVRTEGLEFARAFVTVRLLDQHLAVIPGTEARSEPVLSEGAWRSVSVSAPGGRPAAAWIQIDLELLQPRQFAKSLADEPAAQVLEKHRLYREDVRGNAWFDDVAVVQIPRASITTGSPCNIVAMNEKPELRTTVRDLGGDELRARIRIFDVRGRVVEESESAISPDGRAMVMTPRLPGYGWYSARLDVLSVDAGETTSVVSRAETTFVWLGAGARRRVPEGGSGEGGGRSRNAMIEELDRARFGLIAERTADDRLGDVPIAAARLGTGFVYLPAWRSDSTVQGAAASLAARRSAIDALLAQRQTVTLTIDGVPSELARSTGVPADDALAVAALPGEQWLPYLTPTLDIFGQRVLRYQVGGVGNDHAFWKKNLSGDVHAVETALATLVPGPMMSLPWPADRELPSLARPDEPASPEQGRLSSRQRGPLVDGLTLFYPIGFPPGEVGEAINRIAASGLQTAPELTVVFDLPRGEVFGRNAVVTELTRRAVEFWRLLGDGSSDVADNPELRLALVQPWVWSHENTPRVWPSAEMATLSVLMDRLSGRRIVGELTNVTGVKCYILAARNTAVGTLERGALIAWNESAEPGRAIVDAAAVGASVTVVDAFGNQTPIPVGGGPGEQRGSAPSPLVTVPVGETPVFIEGIDPYLALFAASFRLEPAFMPAVVREHEHRVKLANPWPVRVTGKLQLKEDGERSARMQRSSMDEWRVSPSGIIDFDIAPGEQASLPVMLSFGAGQLAGIKDFVIVARAMADRAYPPIRLNAAVEIGLIDIEMHPELQVGPGGDVIVTAAVTNKGTRSRTFRLDTAARGMPSQQLQVSDLPPGQTVLRRFVFKEAAAELSGRRVVISLSDLEEAERLNKAVMVP